MNIQIGDKFKIMKDHPDTRSEDLRKGDILSIKRICSSYGVSFMGGWSGHIRGNDLYLGGLDKALKRVKPTRLELQEQFNEQQETIESMQSQIHLMAKAIGVNKQGLKEVNKDASQTDSSKEGIRQVIEINTIGEVSSLKYTKTGTWENPSVEEISELKTLDQSVFNGEDEKWQWASFDKDGSVHKYEKEPFVSLDMDCWGNEGRTSFERIQGLEGVGRWEKSLIERDSVELTGSDLCRAMLKRGDKVVRCFVSDVSDSYSVSGRYIDGVCAVRTEGGFSILNSHYRYAVPIDNNGNVLTAKDVGL